MKIPLTLQLALAMLLTIFGSQSKLRAELLLDFTPTESGGVHLDMRYKGTILPDTSRSDWLDLDVPPGNLIQGGDLSSRSQYYFASEFTSEVTLNGNPLSADFIRYVRLGNGADYEQIFLFLNGGFLTDSQLNLHITATWPRSNLAYDRLTPGVYTAPIPRFGGAVITVGEIPEPAAAWLAGLGTCLTLLWRQRQILKASV